jgi:hypothetical protein
MFFTTVFGIYFCIISWMMKDEHILDEFNEVAFMDDKMSEKLKELNREISFAQEMKNKQERFDVSSGLSDPRLAHIVNFMQLIVDKVSSPIVFKYSNDEVKLCTEWSSMTGMEWPEYEPGKTFMRKDKSIEFAREKYHSSQTFDGFKAGKEIYLETHEKLPEENTYCKSYNIVNNDNEWKEEIEESRHLMDAANERYILEIDQIIEGEKRISRNDEIIDYENDQTR